MYHGLVSCVRALGWVSAALALSGCSLLDLSKLSEGSGGSAGASTSASSGTMTTVSGSSTGSSGACASVGCSMHGHCEETGGPHCVCDPHFDGADCAACSAPYVGVDCLACAMGYQDENDDGTCAPACNPTTCSGHGLCEDASGAIACSCETGWSGADCASPCPPGTAGPKCEFAIVYGLDIPTSADWNTLVDVPYDLDKTATTGTFARVGYRLLLDAEEVWVEMDAFTADPALLGVPVTWGWDIPVTNVRVVSTAPNQPSITAPSAGALEFWGDCYDEGPDGFFDVDDNWGGGSGCYGSMQVHVGSKTIFGFNSWANDGAIDIGLGTAPAGQPDWTFHGNAAGFTKRRLEVYVAP